MFGVEEFLTSVHDRRQEQYATSASFFGSVLTAYLTLVLVLGPFLMQKRLPYSLRNTLVLYDLVKIACNVYYFHRIATIFFWSDTSFWCPPVGFDTTDDQTKLVSDTMYFYYAIKMLDLFDTIFIVLRKKRNQLTFHHITHHVSVAIASWVAYRLFPGGAMLWASGIQALAHAVVYFYYFVSAHQIPGVFFLKPYVTLIQMAHFVIVTIVMTINTANITCEQPVLFLLANIVFNIINFFLFSDFYQTAYLHQGHQGFVKQKECYEEYLMKSLDSSKRIVQKEEKENNTAQI
ncbi:Elongation of very long chain fatty acids protein [Gryllus bimaculatus]|nr:Elongation of very long chain fatty acids protein [Gryllus bimaculatus]